MLTEHCDSCAKNLRFHTCNGNVKVCPGFIDRRAGCRRCVNVRSCKKLGKEIGIYHLCVNFEYDTDQNHLIPLEKFPDYEEYLERHSKPKVVEEPKKKRGRPKGNIKKIKKSVTDEAQELISQYEKELAGIEELDAADKAALKNANYESQPVNWSPETLANTIIDNNYDPRLFELVNEKDILKPTNPVQFIIDPRFLNISLFPMQLKIALDYFAAFCTDCSDTEFIRKVKVNTPIEEIIDRTVLYVNGICPKCGKSRYEHILEKSHHNYNTLVGIAGQRCVTGDTQVITENGIISMQSIADLHTCVEGFIKYNGPKLLIEDGTLIEPSFFYRSKPEETFRVTLKNGISICGTQEHPIFTSNGFKKIKELKINDIIPLYDGKSVHTSYINIDNYFDASDCIEWTETSIIQSIQKDKIQETFDFYIPNYHRFIGNNILNHNSGKSIFHGILAAAVLGQYLALPNPVTYMKSVAQATFTMTFVGLRFQDAYDNLWRDFYANVTESPWFKMYNNFLIEEGIRLGKPLIKQADTFITYIGKRISVNPSGPDKRKLRGRCITGNMLINTNKGLFRASSNSLKKYLVYDRGYYYNIGVEKQKEQKHCVSCYFSNGLLLEASEDHKIPCYDLTTYLTEAKDLQNKYVMCQLGGGFGESVSEDPYHMNKKDTLQYIAANMNSFEFTSYSRKLQLAILKFCFCKIIKNKIVLSKYDANILAQELGRNPISFEKQDCRDYLIPGTNVYTKSELNKLYNVYVPEYLNQYIDKGIVFVRCVKVVDLGERDVYDIEVFSNDHLYSANGIIVHNTRILGSMDEVSYFFGKDASMTLDADEVSIALENSLKTVRNSSSQLLPKHPDIPQAHAIYISSPRSKLDKGMRLFKQSSYVESMYGFHMSTWNFNPNFTKESFKDEYARDPIAAETNFGANPPFGDKQFISNPALLLDIISKRKNVFEIIKYNTTKDSLGASLRYPIIRVRPHGLPSILSVDAGYNNNSFALCLMHLIRKESEDEEGVKDVVACSGVIEIQPDEGLALSFPKIYDMVISRIIKEFNVKMLAVDRWQSIDIRQRVYEEFGIESIQYSVVYDDFLNLRDDITSGNFMLPRCEQEFKEIILMDKELKVLVKNKPISHLIIQMLTSKDTGRTVTKGEETSDDILRAMCLGHAMLIDEDYAEIFADDYQEESNSVSSFGASVMYSNMGNSGNTNLSGIGCKISI